MPKRKPPTQTATIYDVARNAGVSPATVSRVLSNPDIVTERTRAAVRVAVEQLGFSPNTAAKSLRTTRTRKLLVTVPDIANPFFSLIIRGIEEAAQRDGYAIVLGDTHLDANREEHYAQMLLQREVDGLIFLGHRIPAKLLPWIKRRGASAPIVNGCEYSPGIGVPSVHIDNRKAAAEAIDHLYGLGHRRIGVITGPLSSPLSRDRLEGVEQRARARRAQKDLLLLTGDFTIDSGIASAAELFAQKVPPTAIFCFSDEMAIGVLDYAQRHGMTVPGDLSIVGFDDVRIARYVRPALTTVAQPMLDMGRETVRLLLGLIAGTITKPISVTLPYKLEIRASTGAPR
jgi:LacI family transcriptional regulator, repressor for deo operon, udp, cdd, tsx, nupC, and nupG